MLEFAREGQRFYDLRRWTILEKEIVESDKKGKKFFISGKHDYFPILQSEIDTNPLIEQNPYW
jgi:starch-binding outer membrane protein, SusD/RagB family